MSEPSEESGAVARRGSPSNLADLHGLEAAARAGERAERRRALDAARAALVPSAGPRARDPGSLRARAATYDAFVRGTAARHLPATGFAVLATGGYGRGEVAPRSDLDLLLLRRDDAEPAVLEPLVRDLWDAGLEVGSAVRTLAQTDAALATDLHAATATLEGRFVAGDRALFAELRAHVAGSFVPANGLRFARAKIDETTERHRKRGGTIFLLAPDLKEGRGTLRDLELARLLAVLVPPPGSTGASPAGDDDFVLPLLPRADVILARWLELEAERTRALDRAAALLAATRAAIHELEPVRTERLEHASQAAIAQRFGYRERAGRLGVENFLRDVYLAARAIDRTRRLATDRTLRALETPRATGRTQRLGTGIFAVGTELHLEAKALDGPGALERASELFHLAQRTKREVPLGVREQVRRALQTDEATLERFRADPAVIRAFRAVLAGATHVAATLRAMHDSGYLDELLPEFGALDCLAQADAYHAYTVDEHTLAAIAALEGEPASPDGGTVAPPEPPGREDRIREDLLHHVQRRDLLRLGLLLHDAGKTGGNLGHVERGVALVPDVARRMGLTLEEERHVRFLVEHHLTLSKLVETRDVDAPETRKALLDACNHEIERLDHLYLMTVADVRAVSPRAFTRWKDTLMTRLYERAREQAGQEPQPLRILSDEDLVADLEPRLPEGVSVDDLREHLVLSPRPYLVEADPDEVLLHLELVRDLGSKDVAFRVVNEEGFDRIWIATRDRPRLFAALCGALAASGLSINGAQAFTRKDGVILDRFAVVTADEGKNVPPERWPEVQDTIARVIRSEVDVKELVAARARRLEEQPRREGRRPPTRVRISNKVSPLVTVVDVSAPDRPGLLHDLATVLSDLGLDIRLAKIATKGDRAVDVFYVTTTKGEKVQGAAALLHVRKGVSDAARGARETGQG